MAISKKLNPEFGGRQIVTAHGEVNGMFQNYFIVGSGGATVLSMSINNVALSAFELAQFGLDQALPANQEVIIGIETDTITSIEFSAGGAFLFWNNPNKLNAWLKSSRLYWNVYPGFVEQITDNSATHKFSEALVDGSSPAFFPPVNLGASGTFILCEAEVVADVDQIIEWFFAGISIDGLNTDGNAQAIPTIGTRKQRLVSGRIVSLDPTKNNESVAIAFNNFDEDVFSEMTVDKIKFTPMEDVMPFAGVGFNYRVPGDFKSPDEQVIHANHVFKVDDGKLICTASGAGTSYFLWNRDFTGWTGNTTGQAYLHLGTVTGAGAEVQMVKDGGVNWKTAPWVEATDLEYYDGTETGMSPAGITKAGIKIVTTVSGVVEIRRFAFVTGNSLLTYPDDK